MSPDESTILFPPTYRFAKNRRTLDDYVWVKQKRSGVSWARQSYRDHMYNHVVTVILISAYFCIKKKITVKEFRPNYM